jgi:GDP-L-fucose synthase
MHATQNSFRRIWRFRRKYSIPHGPKASRGCFSFGHPGYANRMLGSQMEDEHLHTDTVDPTNRPCALGKIVGIEMCWSDNRQYGTKFLAVTPTNLFGAGDNYDLETSHVIRALIQTLHEAKAVGHLTGTVWGTGAPRRAFPLSDDLAAGYIYGESSGHTSRGPAGLGRDHEGCTQPDVNIGSGAALTIKELAELLMEVVGYGGNLVFHASRPDGMRRELLEFSCINDLGWHASTPLRDGLESAYRAYFRPLARVTNSNRGKL